MTVTVAIPYYGAPDLLPRAVESVLAQTHRDLRLVVVGDGETPPLGGISDERLTVYTLPENRGTYFASQVALQASPHRWYALVGADDWIEPDHISRLMALARRGSTAIATTAVRWERSDGTSEVHRGLYVVGMFRKSRLMEVGGFNPTERIGQDTLLLRLLTLTGPLAAADEPTYHRVRRAGSLTTAPETRLRSKPRNAMRKRNRVIFAKCQRLARPESIRAYRQAIVPRSVWSEVNRHAARLQAAMA